MPVLTHSALLRALGWTLFNSLWQMSLLWACYHFFLLVFSDLPSRARHRLALLLLAAGACWSLKTFVAAWLFSDSPVTPWLSALIPGSPFSTHGLSSVLEAGRRLIDPVLPWCSTLYLLILGGLLVHYFRHYARSRQILHNGLCRMAPEFRVFVSSTARRMGIRAAVSLHGSSLVDVPVTLGFLRPVILLPVTMVTQLTPDQIEAILVHELAHIRRQDYLLNLLVTIMELLFFFNPFARGLIAQLKKEREHCCDEQVMEFRYDPQAYVTALLSLARQRGEGRLAVAAIGGGGEKLLLQRAQRLLQQKRTDNTPGARLLIFSLLTAMIGIVMPGLSHPATAAARPPAATQTRMPDHPASAMVNYPPVSILEQVVILRQMPVAARTAVKAPPPRRHYPTHRSAHPEVAGPDPLEQMIAESPVKADRRRAAKPVTTTFTGLIQLANRDYSMGKPAGPGSKATPPSEVIDQDQPFVPHSSFSFQYTDTIPPEIKLAMLQELTVKELRIEIFRLQAGLRQTIAELNERQAALRKAFSDRAGLTHSADDLPLKELLKEERQLQEEYRINLENLQRQLQKASRRLTIVYI